MSVSTLEMFGLWTEEVRQTKTPEFSIPPVEWDSPPVISGGVKGRCRNKLYGVECTCPQYVGDNNELCKNCGHAYDDHDAY